MQKGIYAKKLIKEDTVIAFYHGIKLPPNYKEEESWEANGYKIFDPSNSPLGTLDIPEEYRSTSQYFSPNSQFLVYDHPRWGNVPCIASNQDIKAGEDIFVRYGYDLNYCPDWYRDS